jgi:hypothetical protein
MAWHAFTLTALPPEAVSRPPQLSPDYTGLVLPPNIAPLNFSIQAPDIIAHQVRIHSTHGRAIELAGASSRVEIPLRPWKELLQANPGQPIYIDVRARNREGSWETYERVTNTISSDPIDGHLVYRLVNPVYSIYGQMGIYQRDLGTFKEEPLLVNRSFERGCVNCHTFLQHRPDQMALHIRHKGAGNPMLLVTSNQVARVDRTSGYLAWHPSGRLLATSVNRFSLFFHTIGETRDLYDAASDLSVYWVHSNLVVTPPAIAKPDRLETWPAWAPDGQYLYFCSAPKLRMERFRQVRYDLMRVAYDIARDQWGEPEVVVSARDTRQSAAQPRISPDGRWLLFCLAPYGNFPAYQRGSNLYLMDLHTRQMRPLEVNSDQSDSWHAWSSNGRWIVFSSKRRDGLFTRPYISHFTEDGRVSKPFILPQQDPDFYDSFGRTYNLPEFVQSPVTLPSKELARGIFNPRQVFKPASSRSDGEKEEHDADEGRSAGLRRE